MARKKTKRPPTEKNEMAFAVELARGSSVAKAAKMVGISETTGYRWARKPEVGKAVAEIRSTVLQEASHRMMNLAGKAVETLEQLLESRCEKVRLSTARTVIDGTAKLRQLAELEQELVEIRKIVATISGHSSPGGVSHAY
jgi:transposase